MDSHGPRDNQGDWKWLSTKEQGKTRQREKISQGTRGGNKPMKKQKNKQKRDIRNKEIH
jgi:hypothetical protein